MSISDDTLTLDIADDGDGFDLETAELGRGADEHGVVILGNLAHNPAFPPGRGIEQQWATGFFTGLELLSSDGVAFPFVGLEEIEGQVQLVFA